MEWPPQVTEDIQQLWREYRAHPSIELRNRLIEHYLPLVRVNAERIWARLPDGVDLDDLISAGIFRVDGCDRIVRPGTGGQV
jgi:RNA polymerase sigma factor for flagellar operon FliA